MRIGVVGCGTMGSGIAELSARAGLDVTVVEAGESALQMGRLRIERSLRRAVERGKLDETESRGALDRLSFQVDLKELASCELVVEAIVESLSEKLALLEVLDEVMAADAVLASNTSSFPIGRLALATRRPARVVGLHFFNPVLVRRLVEVVPSLLTADEVVEWSERFAQEELGRVVVRAPDRAGFIVNALLFPYIMSAIRMHEAGLATAADIDAAMMEGCGHPIGPLALADLVGLDTTAAIVDSLWEESGDPAHTCPASLRRMVEAGWLGRKTGRGFFDYPD